MRKAEDDTLQSHLRTGSLSTANDVMCLCMCVPYTPYVHAFVGCCVTCVKLMYLSMGAVGYLVREEHIDPGIATSGDRLGRHRGCAGLASDSARRNQITRHPGHE